MKQRINLYLLNNGYRTSTLTIYYLNAIINKPAEQTITEFCEEIDIHRSYYYKLMKEHKDFIEVVRDETKN